jgi:hypothetical protein
MLGLLFGRKGACRGRRAPGNGSTLPAVRCMIRQRQQRKNMSKSHDTRKQTKKAPQKTLMEKRAEKRAKKKS